MAQTVSYVLSLTDRMSTPMSKITGVSAQTTEKLGRLQSQSKALKAATTDLGGSLSTLRQRMELLRAEKELINPKNLTDIKRYNREIGGLEKQIDKLDNAGKKGGLSKYFGDLKGSIGAIVNPLTLAATALGFAAKEGISLDEKFAKVNITAQMKGADFEKLKGDIIGVAKKNKVDVGMAPEAFEKIISQTNDVDLSMSILDSTLKGSKAGFTDVSTVADALAQSLSIVGKENASAQEILDTFFAAKRVGAGEFKDFANYMPGLIAGADALGFKYKEVAGVFAYMTGKGQSAERASVLMNNMFSMLGRGEVTKKLEKANINVFDNGKIRSTVDIFKDMAKVTSTMNDQQKSSFIESLGIVDKEAKSAFMVMSADVDKLQSSLTDCANSSGETDRALALSANSAQRAAELWASFKGQLIDFGTAILPLVDAGIVFLGGSLEVVSSIVRGLSSFFGGWYDALADGDPIIWGLTAALGAAGLMLAAHKIKLMAVSAWNTITTATSALLSKAFMAANATMLATPLGWVLLGVAALTAGIIALSSRTDKATKNFAAFNVELSKNKSETKSGFDAAMQAAEGSDTRKEAIRKLNEQYGEYLPHLIREKASNTELALALNEVNIQLERKLMNKFRDQAKEEALKKANDAKTEILNWMLDQVDEDKQAQLATDFSASWQKMESGQSDWKNEEAFYQEKYGVGSGFWNHLMGGMTWAGDLYSNVGGQLMDLQNAAFELQKDNKRIDLLFAPPKVEVNVNGATQWAGTIPAAQSVNPLGFVNIPSGGLQQGQSSPYSIPTASSPGMLTPTTTNPAAVVTGGNTPAENAALLKKMQSGGGGGGGGASNSVFNLDQQTTNLKGSTAYSAVMSKLNRVKIAGLTAASVVGMSASSPSTMIPPISDGATTNITTASTDNDDYNQKNKTLNLDKFCDQIVIHIAKADNQGMDEIRSKVMVVLKDLANGQNA